jgi:hypothetical protein
MSTKRPKNFRKTLSIYLDEYLSQIPLDDEKVQKLECEPDVYAEVIDGINLELKLYSYIEKDGNSAAVFLDGTYDTSIGETKPISAMIAYTFEIPLGMRSSIPRGFRKTLGKYLDKYLSDLPLDDKKVQELANKTECKKVFLDQIDIKQHIKCRIKKDKKSAIITARAFYSRFFLGILFVNIFSVSRKIEYTFDTLDA